MNLVLKLLKLPIVIVVGLFLGLLQVLGLYSSSNLYLDVTEVNPETGKKEKVRYRPYYDSMYFHEESGCLIRVILTLGRERVPEDYPKIKDKDLIELTADIYINNETQNDISIQLNGFLVNDQPLQLVDSQHSLPTTINVAKGTVGQLPTLITTSIGYSLEEKYVADLAINNTPVKVSETAARMKLTN